MSLQIQYTQDSEKPSLVMCIYGPGKVGKTTLATTAPKPLFLDGENGTKGLKTQAINVPVVHVKTWLDIQECYREFKDSKEFETIVIDPLGFFMDALLQEVSQGRGQEGMTLQKWGIALDKFKNFTKAWTLSGKHVLFIAHDELLADEGTQLRRIQLPGKNLPSVFRNMMDAVGYYIAGTNKERELLVQPTGKIDAGSRFNCFEPVLKNPNITEMIEKIHSFYGAKPNVEVAE